MVLIININNGIKEPTQGYKNRANIEFWWVCQSERILVYTSYNLGQYNLSPFCLAMKVLAWYVDLNGLENNNFVKHPYPTSYIHIPQRQVFSYCV